MKPWVVYVHGIGFIGTVLEEHERDARLTAVQIYGAEGERPKYNRDAKIYEKERFSIWPE